MVGGGDGHRGGLVLVAVPYHVFAAVALPWSLSSAALRRSMSSTAAVGNFSTSCGRGCGAS